MEHDFLHPIDDVDTADIANIARVDALLDQHLDQYLAGDLGEEDRATVDAWLATHADAAGPVRGIERVLRGMRPVRTAPPLVAAEAARVWAQRIVAERPASTPVSTAALPTRNRGKLHTPLSLGITSALLLGVAILGTWLVRSTPSRTLAEAHVYRTAPGQRSVVRLADGSTMTMAPATIVTLTTHGMTVTGQAYFSATPRATRPFVVHTSNAVVRVLGTRFNVRQYPGEPTSQIVVEEGRVSVGTQQTTRSSRVPTVLSARMFATVSDSSVTVSSGITLRDYTGWTRGTLVFRGAPLRDVVAELSRAYGADIRVADTTLANTVVGVEVEVNKEPLSQVLGAISYILDAHYVQDGHTFVLSHGRSSNSLPHAHPLKTMNPQPEQQYGR